LRLPAGKQIARIDPAFRNPDAGWCEGVSPMQVPRDGPQRGFRCWARPMAIHGLT